MGPGLRSGRLGDQRLLGGLAHRQIGPQAVGLTAKSCRRLVERRQSIGQPIPFGLRLGHRGP